MSLCENWSANRHNIVAAITPIHDMPNMSYLWKVKAVHDNGQNHESVPVFREGSHSLRNHAVSKPRAPVHDEGLAGI